MERNIFTKSGSNYSVRIDNTIAEIIKRGTSIKKILRGPRIIGMMIEELTCFNPEWTTDDVLESYYTLFNN